MTACVAQFLTWSCAYNTQHRGGSGGKVPAMQMGTVGCSTGQIHVRDRKTHLDWSHSYWIPVKKTPLTTICDFCIHLVTSLMIFPVSVTESSEDAAARCFFGYMQTVGALHLGHVFIYKGIRPLFW